MEKACRHTYEISVMLENIGNVLIKLKKCKTGKPLLNQKMQFRLFLSS